MASYKTPDDVLKTIRAGDDAEESRGDNRVLINRAANNEPLITKEDADKIGMKIYTRWGEMMNALSHARRQYMSNFMSPATFFRVSIPKAPEPDRAMWEGIITETLNEKLKEGERAHEYFELHRSRWSAVVSHGIGPMMWEDFYGWCPRYVAIEDLRIPTDTELSFRNLSWFAVRFSYTPGELSRKAFSKSEGKFSWDPKAVANLLSKISEVQTTMAENNYDISTVPEKFEELRKQNGGYWDGDAMPTINLWHFYHEDDNGKWNLKVVPEFDSGDTEKDSFVCQSTTPIADSWRNILHVQFGDLNNKAPFLYHSVRSLGYALYEPCYWTDFVRCRLLQHVLDQFNILLKISDPVDRARASIQAFQNLGVIKPGVSIVPQTERHQVNAALIESTLAQTKQLQAEASTSYTQQVDTGTQKEQTAFETGVKVQQTNAMLSGLMLVAFLYEKFAYKEICRRFCLKNSDDPDVVSFQKQCKDEGVPIAWMTVDKWRIEPTSPLGNGNPTMAYVESENALKLRPMLDPSAQQEALFDAAVQMVGSSRASRWVKRNANAVSDAKAAASNAFPILMLGLPPQIPEGLNVIDQIQTLLGLAGAYAVKIEKTTKIPSPQELAGLQNASAFVASLIKRASGDQANEPRVKDFAHQWSQLNNEIKKLQQHLMAAMQKQQQQNGNGEIQKSMMETQAKIAGKTAETKQKLMAKELAERQKLRHKDTAFSADQQRQNFKTLADAARQPRQPLEKE